MTWQWGKVGGNSRMKAKHVVYVLLFVVGMYGGNEAVKWYRATQLAEVDKEASTHFNTHAERFSLNDIHGVTHQSEEWQGKILVVNFWATWCPPCLKETPMFVELQDLYAAKGLQFLGIAIDNLDQVKEFIDTYAVNYPILIGNEDAIELAKKYGNRFGALPYTVIINRQGTIVHAQAGEMQREKTEDILRKLL